MEITKLGDRYRADVTAYIAREWGTPIVTRGNAMQPGDLPGFVAVLDGGIAGAVLYRIDGKDCEIVVLYSLAQNKGVGGALIDAVIEEAKEAQCRRVWLITMNDNTHAIRYYQKRGFSLKAVHIDAFKVTQRIKGVGEGDIPGIDGIPILHEFEFEIIF